MATATSKSKVAGKARAKDAADGGTRTITIKPPRFQTSVFHVVGTSPYVANRMRPAALAAMMDKMEQGSQAGSKRVRAPRDFGDDYDQSLPISSDGWYGIPAMGFAKAMIDACRTAQFKMTLGKMALRVLPDGVDKDYGTTLVKITSGKPERCDAMVKNANGSTDVRIRPMWREWSAKVRIRWDLDQFSEEDVANLLARAGEQVGVGAGRPFSENSAGCGWGTFELK